MNGMHLLILLQPGLHFDMFRLLVCNLPHRIGQVIEHLKTVKVIVQVLDLLLLLFLHWGYLHAKEGFLLPQHYLELVLEVLKLGELEPL